MKSSRLRGLFPRAKLIGRVRGCTGDVTRRPSIQHPARAGAASELVSRTSKSKSNRLLPARAVTVSSWRHVCIINNSAQVCVECRGVDAVDSIPDARTFIIQRPYVDSRVIFHAGMFETGFDSRHFRSVIAGRRQRPSNQ